VELVKLDLNNTSTKQIK